MQQPSSSNRGVTTRRALLDDGWSEGALTRGIRGGSLVRVLPGTFTSGGVTAYEQVAAAREHFGDAVAVLGTAAALHGLPTPWPADGLVHVRLPPGREQHQPERFRIHTWKLLDDEITEVAGERVTTVGRTLADLMCAGDRLSAVAFADQALRTGALDSGGLALTAARTRRRRGAARCRDWWSDCDHRSESPLETRVRLRAIDGGHPPHVLQKEFVVDGRTYRTDFAWALGDERWLVAEADGLDVHEVPEAILRDRHRANALVGTGRVDLVRFVWADTLRPETIPRTLARLLDAPHSRRS